MTVPDGYNTMPNQRRAVSKDIAKAAMTGTAARLTVTGLVAIKHLGFLVTAAVAAGENTLKLTHTVPSGSAVNLCAATDTASAALHQLFLLDGVAATGLVKTTAVGIGLAANEHLPIILSAGVISSVFSGSAPATGGLTMFVEYEPLTENAGIA